MVRNVKTWVEQKDNDLFIFCVRVGGLFLRVYVIVLFFRVNVGCGPAEERVLLTGLHAVADIFCECCKTTLGWKYVSFIN